MAKTKTVYTGEDVMAFVNTYVDDEQKKADSVRLIELMQEWSGFEARMWGLWTLVILLLLFSLSNAFVPTPPDSIPVLAVSLIITLGLIVSLSYWVDRNRKLAEQN